MPTWRITAPDKRGKVKKGTSFIVVSRTTASKPDAKDIEEVLYVSGYKESGGGSAISYKSADNWKCEKISDDTYPGWSEQHQKYEDEVERDNDAKREDEYEAKRARKEAKRKGGGSSGCCSICKCIWNILKCL